MAYKRVILHYIRRYGILTLAVAVAASVLLGSASEDLRMLRSIDGSYESIMPAHENDVESGALININTATAHGLTRINGIGEATARAIVEYREARGGFKSVGELVNINGIGEKTLENIRRFVTV